jgi:hypothetical protein
VHIHQRALRTQEKLHLPSAFREVFIKATSSSIDSRPDIDDFLKTIEEIYRKEGIYFSELYSGKQTQKIETVDVKIARIEEKLTLVYKEIQELKRKQAAFDEFIKVLGDNSHGN